MRETLIAVIVSAFGSSGLWAFLQFLVSKRSTIADQLEVIQNDIKSLKLLIDENEAKSARIRIINFADKMRTSTMGKEAWLQVLRDIDSYEAYCDANPDFKNSYAKLSIELIKDTYEEDFKK